MAEMDTMPTKEEVKKLFIELTNKRIHSISLIPDGVDFDLYNVNDAYMLRFFKREDPFYNPRNERDVIRKIAPLSLSEVVLYFDEENKIKLSRFIHGTHLYVDYLSIEQLRYAAKTLKKLHHAHLRVEEAFKSLDRLYQYKKEAKTNEIPNIYERHVIRDVLNFLKKEEDKFTLCHNNLNRHNLLFKFDKMLLVSWQDAAMNHPYFDLASFLSANDIEDEETIKKFLTFYFGSQFNSLKYRRIMLLYRFVDILTFYWAKSMEKKSDDQKFNKIADAKLKRILLTANK